MQPRLAHLRGVRIVSGSWVNFNLLGGHATKSYFNHGIIYS
jgi:hypothetical protein